MKPPDDTFDAARLAALDAYDILDSVPEPGFDDIVELAAHICAAPVALVSLVAADRQWFKARLGFEPCETDLNSSVCAFVLAEPDLLVIPDLRLDPRTGANPLVTGAPGIRFYAGAPLRTTDGHVLGSLCVIDTSPRPAGLSLAQAGALRNLARQVMSQLDLRNAITERDKALALQRAEKAKRRASEQQYQTLFESIDDGFCIIEMKFDGETAVDYRFIEVNPAFERETGLRDAQGKWMRDIAPGHEQHWFDRYGNVVRTGEAARFENPAKEIGDRWFEVHAFRLGDASDRRVGILFSDVSHRRAADLMRAQVEEQQQLLNEELSHRMKNSFAMVQAIASQTLRAVADRGPVEAFTQRLHALSTAHDVLLQESWASANASVVTRSAVAAIADPGRFDIEGPDLKLGPRATLSVALLLHELTTNAVKYGALSTDQGRVSLLWSVSGLGEDAEVKLAWRERGGPPVLDPARRGFGSRLIRLGILGTGGVDLRYAQQGFEADFSAPLSLVLLQQVAEHGGPEKS